MAGKPFNPPCPRRSGNGAQESRPVTTFQRQQASPSHTVPRSLYRSHHLQKATCSAEFAGFPPIRSWYPETAGSGHDPLQLFSGNEFPPHKSVPRSNMKECPSSQLVQLLQASLPCSRKAHTECADATDRARSVRRGVLKIAFPMESPLWHIATCHKAQSGHHSEFT